MVNEGASENHSSIWGWVEEDRKDVERRRKRWEEDAEGRVMNGERRLAVIGAAAE
jgi:phage gp37-like protein